MTATTNRDEAVQAALDSLAAAIDALDLRDHLALNIATLQAAGNEDSAPQLRTMWASIHGLLSDASPEELDHLASVLEVSGVQTLRAVRMVARRESSRGGAYADFWGALKDLTEAVLRGMVSGRGSG